MDIRFRAQDYSVGFLIFKKSCFHTCILFSSIHQVLLSIPQHMDIVPATEIFKMLLDKAIGFKSISIVRQPSLVLYSYDVTTGIVIELGEHFSIIPVIDGQLEILNNSPFTGINNSAQSQFFFFRICGRRSG
jgi:hypothetical protein